MMRTTGSNMRNYWNICGSTLRSNLSTRPLLKLCWIWPSQVAEQLHQPVDIDVPGDVYGAKVKDPPGWIVLIDVVEANKTSKN